MTTRKNPTTSLSAYNALQPEQLSQLHKEIVRAVTALKEANYEGIAKFLMMKPDKIWKRLHECVRAGAIYKPGNTVLTKNGYKSYVYKATQPGQSSEPVTEKSLPGKTISDFSKQIQKLQQTLF